MTKWFLDECRGRLQSDDRVATLTQKATAVLGLLIRRRGDVLSRDEIVAHVWNRIHVQPDIVREYIFDIRTALADDAKAPQYVETIRGRGLTLIGDIEFATSPDSADDRRPAIAVLRPTLFADESKWRHLADSLAEDVTTDLVRFADHSVIARNSAFAVSDGRNIKEIVQQLGVRFVLESSLATHGPLLRTNFQLIDAEKGTHIWAERRDYPLDNLSRLRAC